MKDPIDPTNPRNHGNPTDPAGPTDPTDSTDPLDAHGRERRERPEYAEGPERNGQRRHGLEKHEVPPLPDAIAATRSPGQPEPTKTPNGPSFPVLSTSEHDKLAQRLRHAVTGFVDSPHGSVEEADALLDDITLRLADLLAERRRTLRAAWHDDGAVISETEELRLAMRGYRNVLERLLSI
ncbi:hypothetical protein ABZS86_26120 [Streptomyces sp. NPDC005355]|uniref:hypothetical protein n=1 Tax=Streptomyces sp. NPDC005355 TaxID=3157038 RepID=UPI0033BDBF92